MCDGECCIKMEGGVDMSIMISGYQFEGPYNSIDQLNDNSGVYVILDERDGKRYVLDVGESSQVKTRISNHDREEQWIKNSKGNLSVAVLYTPNKQQPGRKEIEQKLRDIYSPCCGDR